jgi:hypothetical protein
MEFDLKFFNNLKSQIVWEPIVEWIKGQGSYRHFAWRGFKLNNGKKSGVPFFFVYVNVNESNNATSVSLYVNVLRDPTGKGQKLIKSQIVGNKRVAMEILPKILTDQYGINIDESETFQSYFASASSPDDVFETKDRLQIPEDVEKFESKKMINKNTLLAAVISTYKISFYSKISKRFVNGYQIYEMVLNFQTDTVLPKRSIRSPIFPTYDKCKNEADFKMLELKNNGFVEIPSWADMETWDLGTMSPKKFYPAIGNMVEQMENTYKQKTLEEIIELRKTLLDDQVEASNKIKIIKKTSSEGLILKEKLYDNLGLKENFYNKSIYKTPEFYKKIENKLNLNEEYINKYKEYDLDFGFNDDVSADISTLPGTPNPNPIISKPTETLPTEKNKSKINGRIEIRKRNNSKYFKQKYEVWIIWNEGYEMLQEEMIGEFKDIESANMTAHKVNEELIKDNLKHPDKKEEQFPKATTEEEKEQQRLKSVDQIAEAPMDRDRLEELRKTLLDTDDEVKTSKSAPKNKRHAQSEWYPGATPDPKKIEQYLGSPNVDATQIKSVFIGVDDAVSLVNRFDSSLLLNIGLIFNFSNQGAYGVYLPMLDDKIKREKIKSVLKQDGCKIEDKSDGSFLAYSETKSQEEIQKQIDTMYAKLNQEGGHVFGINMNKVLMASKADSNAMNLINQEDINDIITLHLGATIVHEAIHAKGSTSEGPSEQAEHSFFTWALPIINQKRLDKHESTGNINEFSPLIVTPYRRGASSNCWYKKAQHSFPTGAQFGANIPEAFKQVSDFDYGLMFGNMGKAPIETMLEVKRDQIDSPTREFPLEKKMNLSNIEKAAIKIDKEDFITEVLLEKDRKEYDGYNSIERLLENRRPKPIILPKASSNNRIKKVATLFGWMSNLDLTMRERIIPGEESDDFLNFDWDEVKKLPRYNYDGQMYYYCEPRFEPELFDQMISNRPTSFINPAKRFAQKKDPNYDIILNVLNIIENKIKTNKVRGTRLLCSEDIFPFIKSFYRSDEYIKVVSTKKDSFGKHDDVLTVWIYRDSIPKDKIELAEDYVSGIDKSKEAKDIFDFLMGSNFLKKDIIKTILSMAKNICEQYKIEDVFVVGGFPRSIAIKESWDNIHDLDFASAWPDQCIKLGGMLADTLKVGNTSLFHRTMTLSWEWMGIKCDFKGNFNPMEIRNLLRKNNIKTTPLNMDIYDRDFTINMLIYDVNKEIIYDVCKQSIKDIKNKEIKTYFAETETIVKNNPIIILRALKYMIRYGFHPDLRLDRAMRDNKDLLFNGKYSKERIGIGFLELISENIDSAKKLIDEYGLTEKCKEYIRHGNSN